MDVSILFKVWKYFCIYLLSRQGHKSLLAMYVSCFFIPNQLSFWVVTRTECCLKSSARAIISLKIFALFWCTCQRQIFTSTFLFFIPVICFIWERLDSVNFLLHVANWFHHWMFNISYVQYGFVVKMSFLLRLAKSYGMYIYIHVVLCLRPLERVKFSKFKRPIVKKKMDPTSK